MYAWIWRHLPFRKWQYKLVTSLVLITSMVALLWYVVFPWADPLLPFKDVQVTDDSGVVPNGPGTSGEDAVVPGTTEPADDHDIPYSTGSPSPTKSR